MDIVARLLLRPSKRARDIYMGIGGLILILAIISFAGASFTFDEERRALLRPLGMLLGGIGLAFWIRGSVAPPSEDDE